MAHPEQERQDRERRSESDALRRQREQALQHGFRRDPDQDRNEGYDRAVRSIGGDGPRAQGTRATIGGGGFQPAGAEGRRAYDPDRLRSYRGSGSDLRGIREGMVDEVAEPFDEDAALARAGVGHRGRGPRGYRRSDERLREDVCDRLADDRYVDASNIEVAVSAGEVTLDGMVDSRSARRRAEDIAEAVSGVSYVQNNLRVRQPFYSEADRKAPLDTNLGAGGALPSGAGSDASSTSDSGVTGTIAGTGASGAGTGGAG